MNSCLRNDGWCEIHCEPPVRNSKAWAEEEKQAHGEEAVQHTLLRGGRIMWDALCRAAFFEHHST